MPGSLELSALYAPHHRLLIIGNITASLSYQHPKALGRFQRRLPRVPLDRRPKESWSGERVEAELERDRRPPPREAPPYCRSAVSAVCDELS
ncbi:hypothetical protein UPYG_G00338680 [Umbra pygmaea]|uniref:Uncharacterized protein n=1 Tax=Umbra pygmaea TaxID=75934 RepID=A0ABD0W0U5_UMBPY